MFVCACVCAVGEKDTKPEDVAEVTYQGADDFSIPLPSAHRQQRWQRTQRVAAVQAAAAAKKQERAKYRGLLFASKAASAAAGSSGTGSSGGTQRSSLHTISSSSSSSSRSLSTGTASSAGNEEDDISCHVPALLPLLQRSLICSSRCSSSPLLFCAGMPTPVQRLSWCGLAAAPLLLL